MTFPLPRNKLVRIQVFGRHVVFRELAGADLGDIRFGRLLDGVDHVSFEKLPFPNKFLDAFRVCFRRFAKSLIGARLAGGSGSWTFGLIPFIHMRYGAR